jgi:hypothetical protein
VRPHGKAGLMPRHNIIIGGKGTPGGLAGTWLDKANGVVAGVRSPPLRGGQARDGWPCGGRPGDGARGGFLGGTRSARPRCKAVRKPGYSMIPDGLPMTRWLGGGKFGVGVMPTLRACGARPSRGGQSELGWPCGEVLEMTRKAFFSEGRGLRACVEKPGAGRGIT